MSRVDQRLRTTPASREGETGYSKEMDYEENSARRPAVSPNDSGQLLWREDHAWKTAEEHPKEHSRPRHFAYRSGHSRVSWRG